MFKHRLTKFGVSSLFAMFMLFAGGSLQSCKDWLDVYPYDDPGDPEWLGASVYDFLKEGTPNHTYANYVAIIDSLGEKESLAHTGSKTLFVADDAAFERFFNGGNNVWGITSVGEMSKAQMKTILYSSMLDNAMLLDMLSSTGVQTNQEGTCLRRWSSSKVIDSIPLLVSSDLENPDGVTYKNHVNWPTYNKYWDVLRGNARTENLRLAMDGSRVMMVHFLGDYLRKNNIKAEDIEFLFTKKGEVKKTFVNGDAFIYGNKIVSSDVNTGSYSDDTLTITCKNGYIYRMDELLLPPSNMADELRKRPDTRIFSHLLDRFCVPVYDESLTKEFNAYYKTNDSVFKLRYFTDSYSSHPMLDAANSNPAAEERLNIDPGQNNLGTSSSMAEDMAAMFVPNDEVLYDYFANEDGDGHFLLARFAPNNEVSDIESLMSALDSVPQKNIAPFLNNLMKASFAKTVLSKFNRITDDANELMNITENHVDECVIANNGVIYILNDVFGPGAYEAVSAPTLVNDNMGVMRNVISQLRYDYYLLAMDANYSLIIPDDNHFVYYDPLTVTRDDKGELLTNAQPKAYSFHYDTKKPKANGALKFWADVYKFNPSTYEIVDTLTEQEYPVNTLYFTGKEDATVSLDNFAANRFNDLMEYLIIVHNDEEGLKPDVKYYQTKGYATIKIDASTPDNIKMYGGEQLERGTTILVSSKTNHENGVTYCTVPAEENTPGSLHSGVPTPPTRSVFENMQMKAASEYEKFYEFFNVCYPGANYASTTDDGLLKKVFDCKNSKALSDSTLRYSIFYTNTEDTKAYTKNTIPFFNIYHYTVYAPSNESIQEMHELGLPTWEQVTAQADAGNKAKAASMLVSIINFAKYHFQDNSIYVDNTPITTVDPVTGVTVPGKSFSTAVINEKTNRFYELQVKRSGNTFTVQGEIGEPRRVVTTGDENRDWNIMCRDNVYTSGGTGPSATLNNYSSSSYTVLQPIDGALLNESMFGYDGRFKRFAKNGRTVDAMYVDGTGAVEVDGKKCYLVATVGNIKIADAIDGVQEIHKAGYLMKVIDESDSEYDNYLTREKLIVKESQNVLVTDEGLWVKEVKNNKGVVVSYEYATVEKDGFVYIIRYNNDGSVKEEIKIGEVTPEEDGDNN